MSGRSGFAKQTDAEREMLALGNEQVEKGRNIERPNLLHLKEVAQISGEDRANAAAMAKAGVSQASSDVSRGTLAGLRAGGQADSGAGHLAAQSATNDVGRAAAATMLDTEQNLDRMELDAKGKLSQTALEGRSAAMEGLRAGSSALGMADINRTANRNLKREADAKMYSQALQLGLKGLSMGAAKFGMDTTATGSAPKESGFWGGVARSGLIRPDDATIYRDQYGMRNAMTGPQSPWSWEGSPLNPANRQRD